MPKNLFLLLLVLSLARVASAQTPAAKPAKVVQLSGLVVASDSVTALEGVAVYVAGTTRGTHTRQSGYFSLPIVAGDTVVFAALGYEKLYLTVPANTKESSMTRKIILEKKENTLPTVDVMPWATENDLKQAILRTRLPEEPSERLPVIPPPVVYKSLTDMPAMDATQNFRHGQQLLQQSRENRHRAPDIFRIIGIPIR